MNSQREFGDYQDLLCVHNLDSVIISVFIAIDITVAITISIITNFAIVVADGTDFCL